MIQALIFDFDGLMVDTETPELQIWKDLFASYGQVFPLEEWVRIVVGSGVSNLDPVTRLEQLTGLQLDHQALHQQAHQTWTQLQTTLQPMPGVVDTLQTARAQGLRLAIASSSPHTWVEGFLKRLGFEHLFEAVVCREDAPRTKPAPDLYLAALSTLGLRADQALALEDSPNGITAAKAAGVRVLGVPNAVTSLQGPLPADLTLHSLASQPLGAVLAYFGDRLELRPESGQDIPGIRAVETAAFSRPAEARLVEQARQHGRVSLSMVAVEQGSLVGHVLLTPLSSENGSIPTGGLGLGPLAVAPEAQGKGVGARLVRAALERARSMGHGFVVLLGDPAYYARFGFKPGRSLGLTSDYGSGDEFQALELRVGALAGADGRVHYIPEFGELDG